jgi:hypothetical protein
MPEITILGKTYPTIKAAADALGLSRWTIRQHRDNINKYVRSKKEPIACMYCGKPFIPKSKKQQFDTRDCRLTWLSNLSTGVKRKCMGCGELFDVPRHSPQAVVCPGNKECYRKHMVKRAKRVTVPYERKPTDAPRHIRATYCVRQVQFIGPVRCKVHQETCGEGCFKAVDGRPVCRVEPDHVPEPSFYRSTLAGAVI